MRIAVFIVYLFSFLLKGNHYALEQKVQDKHSYAQTVDKYQRSKFLSPDFGNTIDDNADVDEEEHGGSDDIHDDSNNDGPIAYFPPDFIMPHDWFQSLAGQYFFSATKRAKDFTPVYGNLSPIYIKHRVLRI